MTLKVTVVWEIKNIGVHFLSNFGMDWMKFSMLPQHVGLLKLMLHLLCTSNIQRKELCWCDFTKCMINIVLCQNTCEPVCVKLGMMLDMTKFYSLNALDVHSRSQGDGKARAQSFCCKVVWSNSNVHDGWLCKGDDCEEVMYGKYWLLEHLFLLLGLCKVYKLPFMKILAFHM